MTEMTHETCSELLTPYLSGELARAGVTDVEEHLAACAECTLELAGLTALAVPQVEPLNEVERAAMVRGVRAVAGPTVREPFSIRWGRRFAPALGAAALLAIIAVGVITFNDEGAEPSSGAGVAEDAGGDAFDADQGAGGGGGAAQNAGSPVGDAAAKNAKKAGAGAQTEALEAAEGVAGQDNATLAQATSVAVQESFSGARFDASLLVAAPVPDMLYARRAARDLAASAPDAQVGRTIRRCATGALDATALPLIPTYAAYFTRDDIVMIGFVWTDESTGTLRYVLRGWRGNDCDPVYPIFRSGELP